MIPPFKVLREAAPGTEILHLLAELDQALPEGYLNFLRASNGAECGPNDLKGDSLRFLPCDEVVRFNEDYSVWSYLPELLCFASDGGDHAFAFDRAAGLSPDTWPIVKVPLGALFRDEFDPVAPSFAIWEAAGYRYGHYGDFGN